MKTKGLAGAKVGLLELEAQGNTSGAIEAYRKTLELQPELYEAKERLDALLSGRVFPFAKSENQRAPLKM